MQEKLSLYAEDSNNLTKIVDDIQTCKPTARFSTSLFKELLIKTWSVHANQCVKNASINTSTAKNLLQIAEQFKIHDQDVEQNLLTRLSNIKMLVRLQHNQPIENNVTSIPGGTIAFRW